MRPVTVVGAGFSGLTLAYYLRQHGMPVEILEQGSAAGGLIKTQHTPYGLAETAANALLADAGVESLFADLKLGFAGMRPERTKRYIFLGEPRRWPVSFWTSLKMLPLAAGLGRPHAGESIAAWGARTVNSQFVDRLLAPGLQGVYAGDPKRLSAPLVMARHFARKPRRGRLSGSVAPVLGMGQLIEKLTQKLKELDVPIQYEKNFQLHARPDGPVVLCTSAWAAAEAVKPWRPELSEVLSRCESLPLISVTIFFPRGKNLRGFGCLFPSQENFHALGVLFNDCIFTGRGELRSETWIFGGALNPDIMKLSDQQVFAQLASNRGRLCGRDDIPLHSVVTRWPRAIPHYTVEWERALSTLTVDRPLFLHGNYLGALGLSSILARSRALSEQIKDLYAQ